MKDKLIKRKLLNDRKFPNSEQINKHQNFERLQNDFSLIKKLLLKKTLLWTGLISGVVIATVVVVLTVLKKEDKQNPVERTIVATSPSYVLPPLPEKNIACMIARISSKAGAELTYSNGSTISIPANAFVNVNGKMVSDSVEIRYREFHDPLDIFLSGIPMTYDSAGTAYTLESAGMIEITAFDKGEALNLDKEKTIKISMVSTNNEERFNLYELDTISKNWVYKGKDKIEEQVVAKPIANTSVTKNETPALEQAEPLTRPMLSDPQKFSFKIAYDATEFPELKAYENVMFQVTDDHFKPAYFKINWDKISLYSGEEKGDYIVKLKKKDTTINVTAVPVFDATNYSKALAKFEAQHNSATKERDRKELEKKEKLSVVNKGLSSYNRNNIRAAASNMGAAINRTYRTFFINNMGIHNCDFPLPPNPIIQIASTMIEAGKISGKFTYSTIFIVEKGKNTVFRFSKGDPIRCNFQTSNLIWTITDKNDIAFFKQADLEKSAVKTEKLMPVVSKNQEEALMEIRKFCDQF
jgi:archaellum component FlaF (FlaF/FlaG flagellin family)